MVTRPAPPSASALLARARRFDALVARFRNPLIQYFRKRGIALPDAEDMVQDVFLKLLRKMDADTADLSDGYVFSAASSVLIDHHRRSMTQPTMKGVDLDPEHGANEPSPETIFADRQALRVMLNELPAMREMWRKAFVLNRFEQLSHEEVARRLRISVSSAEKSVAHAVAHLRQKLGRDRDG
ncbi:RNA polymerase sigma factor [Brevundimonas sp.]|uniref:RNA polymerase sigma factor n=1 Tax=Brevundimonas sp. TaxID=1871086 RepID=UPI003D0BA40E